MPFTTTISLSLSLSLNLSHYSFTLLSIFLTSLSSTFVLSLSGLLPSHPLFSPPFLPCRHHTFYQHQQALSLPSPHSKQINIFTLPSSTWHLTPEGEGNGECRWVLLASRCSYMQVTVISICVVVRKVGGLAGSIRVVFDVNVFLVKI